MKTTNMIPKFEIGNIVKLKKCSLYDETKGEVYDVSRLFQEIDENNQFIPKGLMIDEAHIENIVIPYDYDKEKGTLTVHHTNRSYSYRFKEYGYTIKTAKMLCGYPERLLSKFK